MQIFVVGTILGFQLIYMSCKLCSPWRIESSFFQQGHIEHFYTGKKILLCTVKAHKAGAYPPVSVVLSGWESLTLCGWDTSPSQVNPQHKPVPNFSLVVWDNLDKVPCLSAQNIQVTTAGFEAVTFRLAA